MSRVLRPLELSASSRRSVLAVPNTSTLCVASSVSTLWMPVLVCLSKRSLARTALCRAFYALEALVHSSNAALAGHVNHELHGTLAAPVSSRRLTCKASAV